MKKSFLALTLDLFVSLSFAGNYAVKSMATCTGAKDCKACKNCKYYKHCAKNDGTRGVCKKS